MKKRDMSWVKLTDEFKYIIGKIENTNKNYFITGKAGTGKSTLLQYLFNSSKKKCVLVAPTGRSAINIGGQTIHSFFQLDWGVIQASDYTDKKVSSIKHLDVLIIDEISMVRSDILDSIDQVMKTTMKNEKPFGGKQVIFFGDPYQLPPIIPQGEDLESYFKSYYKSEYFFDAKVYVPAKIKCFELSNIFRQQDEDFISVLNKIRNGSYEDEDLSFINRMVDEYDFNDEKLILTPYKNKAAAINQIGLKSLESKEVEFKATLKGKIKAQNVPVEEVLKLKEGAKVMFVKNNRPYWVNGSVGIVQEIDDKVLTIKKGWKNYDLQPTEWEEYKFKYNRGSGVLEKSLVGTFSQMPLILAWAITIHKGQGTTLDSVHIDLDRGSFDFGQTYVALSRTRQLSDISIEKPIKSSDIKVDERINKYFESIEFEKY